MLHCSPERRADAPRSCSAKLAFIIDPYGDSMSFADARVRAAADHSDRDWFVLVKCHDLFRSVENLGKTNCLR